VGIVAFVIIAFSLEVPPDHRLKARSSSARLAPWREGHHGATGTDQGAALA
jgi:hypothetical protein